MNRQDKNEQMISLVNQWEQSGLSQIEFARLNSIKLFTLRYWIHKHQKANIEISPFLELNPTINQSICLRYPNGVELQLPTHTPLNLIKGLIGL
jgi:hypothetical protein